MVFENCEQMLSTITTANNLMLKYPNKVAIILLPSTKFKLKYKLKRYRYLVDRESSFPLFIFHVKQTMKPVNHSEALFFYTEKNILPPANQTVGQIYDEHKNTNGVLFLSVDLENVFGSL